MNRPEFETQEEWRNGVQAGQWWRDIHWTQCAFAGLLGFALGLLAWGLA